MARTRVRAVGALTAVAVVALGVVATSGAANADQTPAVTTPYVHSYPGVGGTDPTITAMAKGSNGRPWFVTADGRAGYVAAGGTSQYLTVSAGDELDGLALASDGALWTADVTTDTAYRIAPSGAVSSVVIGVSAASVVARSDGSVWFLDADSPSVVRVAADRSTTTFKDSGTDAAAPTKGGSGPQSMVVGSDGSVWFAPSDKPVVERVSGSTITRFALTDIATTLTLGSDGNVWAGLAAGGMDRITPAGAATVFAPAGVGGVLSAVTGSDGRTWVAEQGSGFFDIAAVTTTGSFQHFSVPSSASTLPLQLTSAPDGSVWFAQYRVSGSGADIATRITTAGAVSSVSLSSPVYGLTATASGVWYGDSTGTVSLASMPGVDRISGPSRYDTSVALAQAASAGKTGGTVFIATGTNYPDALAAGPAAAKLGGPLLLTSPTALPDVVAQELRTLAPKAVYIVGGTSAVSDTVAGQIQDAVGTATGVFRLAGADRFDTARVLDRYAFGGSTVTSAYIATGTNYPDALAAAAAAGSLGQPVILVNGGAQSLDQATKDFLSSLGVRSVTLVGGTSAVSGGIFSNLVDSGYGVNRIAGDDRFDTATKIAANAFPSATHAYVATGTAFPDALAGSALAALQGAPLLTTRGECLSSGTLQEIAQLGATTVTVIGGTSAVSTNVSALQTCS